MAFSNSTKVLVTRPKISILMAVHEQLQPEFFFDAVNSITVHQTLIPDEIIIVDDGDTFLHRDIVYDFLLSISSHIQFKAVQIPINSGFGFCLAEGLKYCSGDYIVRMDPDDISPTRVQTQLSFQLILTMMYAAVQHTISDLPAQIHFLDFVLLAPIRSV